MCPTSTPEITSGMNMPFFMQRLSKDCFQTDLFVKQCLSRELFPEKCAFSEQRLSREFPERFVSQAAPFRRELSERVFFQTALSRLRYFKHHLGSDAFGLSGLLLLSDPTAARFRINETSIQLCKMRPETSFKKPPACVIPGSHNGVAMAFNCV